MKLPSKPRSLALPPSQNRDSSTFPAFGGVAPSSSSSSSKAQDGVLASGSVLTSPEDERAQGTIRYLLDAARHAGVLTEELHESFVRGALDFHSGQIFFTQNDEIEEVRLDFSDKTTRYTTTPPPQMNATEAAALHLPTQDETRRHVSICFVFDEEKTEFLAALTWNTPGPRKNSYVAAMAATGLSHPNVSPPLPIPVSPPLQGALRAIFAGGPSHKWQEDLYGRPQYRYETRDGVVTLFFEAPLSSTDAVAALFLAVQELSVETADVFLILMSKIARLPDPTRDIAKIGLKEIAEHRSVRLRQGSVNRLLDDFKKEVTRLADLRLNMTWKDYKTGGLITFGKRQPDRLLDIVDWTFQHDRRTWTAFTYRCGQALAFFLDPEALRWVGYYSRALLELNPYQEALTKKLGTFWILTGMIAGKKGKYPQATLRAALDFCGEELNWRNPNRTVDRVLDAHHRLIELGLVQETSRFEPENRGRGYFERWLDTPRTLKLADNFWTIARAKDRAQVPSIRRRKIGRNETQKALPFGLPESPRSIQDNPDSIRRFRTDYHFRQEDLAKALGIRRETLSRYERALRPVPTSVARHVLELWQERAQA